MENLCVYEIKHESEFDPRVTLSRETFRLMSNYGVKKALAVYVSESSSNYRFSLATIELKLQGTRVTKDYSNPRRYSFFLGPDAKIHTPTKYLITNGRIRDLSDLQNRFSIEVVTKEFFGELSNWYFWALKNIGCPKDAEKEQNGKNIWTIRLIARLIFIWFMKHKGLIPENLFNNEYLNKTLKDLSPDETTYYKAILQNLFFATLNTSIKERKFRFTIRGWKNPSYMDHRVYRYEDYFINKKDMLEIFKDIPFLNGGLFECLDSKEGKIRIDGFSDREDSQASVPNDLFFSDEQVVDLRKDYGPEEKYKKCKVRGIINLLQLYNFTIDESTPVDVEIALDPELLGRVFENLLASYNPETATTARKATGSYYTPREIVDYMVTQSLKEYFKTKLSERDCHCEQSEAISKDVELDKKLNDLLSYDFDGNPFNEKETDTLINSVNVLKIIDPAVGSGAFPMVILQKLVLVLSKLDSHNEKWKNQQIKPIEENVQDIVLKNELIKKIEDNFKKNELDYGRKLYLIQNCIYGVDIQPIATQIAKLRFFISLLVDEKRDRAQENYGIEPLPNLELKFISANSLIGLKLKGQLDLKDLRLPKLEEELKRIREIYFRTSDIKQKEKLREEDEKIRNKISSLLKQSGFLAEDTQKIAEWDPYNSNKSADWFDPEWMFGITDGFDIVIANPPYDEISNKEDKKLFQKVYFDVLSGHYDLYIFFFRKSFDVAKKGGFISFITPHTYLHYPQFKNLRKWLYENSQIIEITNRISGIFESSVVDNAIILLKIGESKEDNISKFTVKQISNGSLIDDKIINLKQSEFNSDSLDIEAIENRKILDRFFGNTELLGDVTESSQGITVYAKVQGEKINWFRMEAENKNTKPVIRGRDLSNYFLKWSGEYIQYGDWLWCPRNQKYFEKEKLFFRQTADCLIGTYVKEPMYCIDSVHSIINSPNHKNYNLKYILSILNSKFGNYLYRLLISETGKVFAQVKLTFLRKIPIKKISAAEQKLFVDLVDKILSITKDNDYLENPAKQAKVKEYEQQIDQMVYKLYGLTEEEKRIVEKFNKK